MRADPASGLVALTVLLLLALPARAAPPAVGTPWDNVKSEAVPKPVSTDTWLVRDGRPAAVIAVPDDPAWRPLAAELQAALGPPEVPVVPGRELVEGPCFALRSDVARLLGQGGRNLILLGDLSSNPAVARLYIDWFAFEDAAFPGRGGHTLRTVVDPYGLGWNVVILGGPGLQEVAAALHEYLPTLRRSEQGVLSPYRLSLTWGEGAAAAEIKRRHEQIEPALPNWEKRLLAPDSAEYRAAFPGKAPHEWVLDLLDLPFAYPALSYGLDGSPTLARFTGRVVDALYDHLEWVEAHRQAVYDEHYYVEIWLRAWQQVAGSPYLTETQRQHGQAVMAFLAGQMAIYQWDLAAYGATHYRVLSRHEYAGIFGGDALCRYVQRHCALSGGLAANLQANRANFGTVIDTMLGSYCDGFDHKWGLDGNWHLLQAALEEPRPGYVTSGLARLNADHAAMCIDNGGRFVNFGAENVGPLEGYDAWQILGRAALLEPGGGAQWLLDHKPKKTPYKVFIMSLTWLGHWYQTAGASQPPEYLTGLNRLPLNRLVYDDLVAGRGRVYAGIPVVNKVPYDEAFSKLTMRDGLDDDDQYLLLDGLGGVTYSGNDAGAISAYGRFGQPLLVQIDTKPDPFYQNTVSVSRGDATDATGTFAQVEEMAEVGPLLMLRCGVDPLCGARHVRHLFMERGGWCVAFDDVTLPAAGEYSVTCNFRALGTPHLAADQRTWDVTGETAELHLQNLALPGELPAPSYAQTDRVAGASPAEWQFKIRLLRETAAGEFAAGTTYRFANLFYGVKAGDQPAFRAVALSRDALAVKGPQTVVLAAPASGQARLGALDVAATAFRLTTAEAQFTSLRRLAVNGQVLAEWPAPVTVSLSLARQSAVLQPPRLKPAGTVKWQPEWRAEHTFAELAQGVTLPDGARIRLVTDGLQAALAVVIGLADAAPAESGAAPPPAAPLPVAETVTLLPPGPVIGALELADLDGDGAEDLLCGREDGHLLAVNPAGKLLWELETHSSPVLSVWAGALTGQLTVLCGTQDGWLRALDAAGKLRWEVRNTQLWYGPQPSAYSLAVGDFRGDGTQQIAMGTHGGVSLFEADGRFVRFTQVYAHAVRPAEAVNIGAGPKQTLLVNTWGGGLKLVDPAVGLVTDGWGLFWGGFANHQAVVPSAAGRVLVVQGGSVGIGCGWLDPGAWAAGKRAGGEVWGKESWYRRTDGDCRAVLVREAGGETEIVSGNEAGFLVGYSLQGEVKWRKLLGGALLSLDPLPGGRVLAATERDGLVVLDAQWRTLGTWRPADGDGIRQVELSGARVVVVTERQAVLALKLAP